MGIVSPVDVSALMQQICQILATAELIAQVLGVVLRTMIWRSLPLDGDPSIICRSQLQPLLGYGLLTSNRTNVSLSLYWFGATPVVSRRMMESSMCLIFNLTSKKYILPTITSLRWYLLFEYSNSICRQSSIPTSILMELFVSGGIRYEYTQISFSLITSAILLAHVTRTKYRNLTLMPLYDSYCFSTFLKVNGNV